MWWWYLDTVASLGDKLLHYLDTVAASLGDNPETAIDCCWILEIREKEVSIKVQFKSESKLQGYLEKSTSFNIILTQEWQRHWSTLVYIIVLNVFRSCLLSESMVECWMFLGPPIWIDGFYIILWQRHWATLGDTPQTAIDCWISAFSLSSPWILVDRGHIYLVWTKLGMNIIGPNWGHLDKCKRPIDTLPATSYKLCSFWSHLTVTSCYVKCCLRLVDIQILIQENSNPATSCVV